MTQQGEEKIDEIVNAFFKEWLPESLEEFIILSLQELVLLLFLSSELIANKEKIIREGMEGVREAVEKQVEWRLSKEISNCIDEVFKDKDMQAQLSQAMGEFKKSFIEHLSNAFQEQMTSIAAQIAINMQKRAIKNLAEDSWSMRDFYKKIFE